LPNQMYKLLVIRTGDRLLRVLPQTTLTATCGLGIAKSSGQFSWSQ